MELWIDRSYDDDRQKWEAESLWQGTTRAVSLSAVILLEDDTEGRDLLGPKHCYHTGVSRARFVVGGMTPQPTDVVISA